MTSSSQLCGRDPAPEEYGDNARLRAKQGRKPSASEQYTRRHAHFCAEVSGKDQPRTQHHRTQQDQATAMRPPPQQRTETKPEITHAIVVISAVISYT